MPSATKVNALQRKIRGDQSFMPWRNTQNSAIIANTGNNSPAFPRLTTNPGDQRFFR
jgi:hypothetical protein